MGLAASQARFLNLVARKTNIEYEGQQINQQRTTLANQSANYYNSMLTLQVPTPPSTDSFQRVVYSVSYNGDEYKFSQITKTTATASSTSPKYNIAYTTTFEDSKMVANNGSVSKVDGKYYFDGDRQIKSATDSDSPFTSDMITQIKREISNDEGVTISTLYYANRGSESIPSYVYFASQTEGDDVQYFEEQTYQAVEQGVLTNATIIRDANNRISAISTEDLASGRSLSVTSTSITDEDAYNDAYNEYTYKTYLYQQQMENINAQTSVIQAQDKKLELRLKQLDTEQSAISQEMDSVSAVIDKNMEDSFKAFA